MDKGLWRSIKKQGRDTNLKIQQVQDRVVLNLHATLEVADKIAALRIKNPKDPEIIAIDEGVKECIFLQGNHSYNLSLDRREAMRPRFGDVYTTLCNRDQPVTDLLFTKELTKEVQNLKESAHATKEATNLDKHKPKKTSHRPKSPERQDHYKGGDSRKWQKTKDSSYKDKPYSRENSYNKGNNRGKSHQPFRGGHRRGRSSSSGDYHQRSEEHSKN